jgi:type IV pilus assembly protein PilY1
MAGYITDNYAAFRADNASRASMIYVGANEGMLHGFDAASGQETIAYVPQGIYDTLPRLTSPGYVHAYFVDGSPFAGDIHDGSRWHTYLAGFLGAGGRGYFALDVTDPSAFSEGNAAGIVKLDKTAGAMDAAADPDLGHIFSEPVLEPDDPRISQQITKLNNGRWALVTGNGYNSANEDAVLLIQYLEGSMELVKIATGSPGGNGLSAPRLIDLDGDRIPDVAYAGDLKGQLWKFDLSSRNANKWTVAFDGAPFFAAKNALAQAQPITSAPVSLAHPDGGVMLVVGTGRHLTDADRSDTTTQSVYGLYDNTVVNRSTQLSGQSRGLLSGGSPIADGRAFLVQQAIDTSSTATTASGQPLWSVSSNPVDYAGANPKRGWYLDLPTPGERVLDNLTWAGGNLVDVTSTIPPAGGDSAVEPCDPSAPGSVIYTTTINAINGSAPKSAVYAVATGGSATGPSPSRIEGGGPTVVHVSRGPGASACVTIAGKPCEGTLSAGKMRAFHPSWHQLQ